MKELITKYLKGEITAVSAIRSITDDLDTDYSRSMLILVNEITKLEMGELDRDAYKKQWNITDETK
jgi:hypothetical protein